MAAERIGVWYMLGAIGADQPGEAATSGWLAAYEQQRQRTIGKIAGEVLMQRKQRRTRVGVESAELKDALEKMVRRHAPILDYRSP